MNASTALPIAPDAQWLHTFRAELRDKLAGAPRHAAVVGAGIAGLVLAHELLRAGWRVTVYEGAERIGGRILTSRYKSAHAELGAMRIPACHTYTHEFLDALEIATEAFYNHTTNCQFHLRDRTFFTEDYATLASLYTLSDTDAAMVRGWGAMGPLGLRVRAMTKGLSDADIHAIQTGDVASASEVAKQLDRESLFSYLSRADTEFESITLFADAAFLKDVWQAPCTALLREVFSKRSEGLVQPVDGMDRFPEAMLKAVLALGGEFELNMKTEVVRMDCVPGADYGARLWHRPSGDKHCTTGTEARFDAIFCTAPFGVLRAMPLDGVSSSKKTAIDRFGYAASTKVTLFFSERFWEQTEHPVFGGASVTDALAGQIFFPSNSKRLQADTTYTMPLDDKAANAFGPSFLPAGGPRGISRSSHKPDTAPGVVIGSYAWGTTARRIAAMPEAERIETIARDLRVFYGSAVDDYLDGGDSIAWETHRWSRGAFGQPNPEDLLRFKNVAEQPEGNLYFVGEQLSPDPGWMNGSIFSALQNLAWVAGINGRGTSRR